MSDYEYETLLTAARELGRAHGENAASWVFDGNTSLSTYERVLKGIEDGDPEVMDELPSPDLSGQWAGEPSAYEVVAAIFSQAGLTFEGLSDDGDAAILDEYEQAFCVAAQEEVARVARLHGAEHRA